eukprot:3517029-Rhodomonas_salina.1
MLLFIFLPALIYEGSSATNYYAFTNHFWSAVVSTAPSACEARLCGGRGLTCGEGAGAGDARAAGAELPDRLGGRLRAAVRVGVDGGGAVRGDPVGDGPGG